MPRIGYTKYQFRSSLAMDIYIFKNEQQYGPYTVEQLREYVQQGHFTLEDYACWDGQNWIPLSKNPGFSSQAQAGQTHQPVQAQMAELSARSSGNSSR